MKQQERVELDNLGNGAAKELFESELVNVIANILDPNTRADAVRSITLKVKIKPDKNTRSMCTAEISCESKLAALQPYESTLFVGMEHGEAVATEYNPEQHSIPFPEQKQNEIATKLTKIK